MLNAHFKSSGFNQTQRDERKHDERDERKRDLRVLIEQPVFAPPEVRDLKPGGGWFAWR